MACWPRPTGSMCSARTPDKQPPLRILASLDNSDRTQLGLDLNELVQGEVGVEVLVSHNAQRRAQRPGARRSRQCRGVSGQRRLAQAEGPAQRLPVRRGQGQRPYPTELHNVKLVGDNVAIEGWMGIGPDHKLKEFRFPQFSLNVDRLPRTHGKAAARQRLGRDREGPHLRRPRIFRSFFDVGRVQDDPDARTSPASTCAPKSTPWSGSPTPRCAT